MVGVLLVAVQGSFPFTFVLVARGGSDTFAVGDTSASPGPPASLAAYHRVLSVWGDICVWQYQASGTRWVAQVAERGFGLIARWSSSTPDAFASLQPGELTIGLDSDAGPLRLQSSGGYTQLDGSKLSADQSPFMAMFSTVSGGVGFPYSVFDDLVHTSSFYPDWINQSGSWTYSNSWAAGSGTDEPFRWRRLVLAQTLEFSGVLVPGTTTDGTAVLSMTGFPFTGSGWDNPLTYDQYIPGDCLDGSTENKSLYLKISTANPPVFTCYGVPAACTKIFFSGLVHLD
jgi:hypothetical protein